MAMTFIWKRRKARRRRAIINDARAAAVAPSRPRRRRLLVPLLSDAAFDIRTKCMNTTCTTHSPVHRRIAFWKTVVYPVEKTAETTGPTRRSSERGCYVYNPLLHAVESRRLESRGAQWQSEYYNSIFFFFFNNTNKSELAIIICSFDYETVALKIATITHTRRHVDTRQLLIAVYSTVLLIWCEKWIWIGSN